MSVIPIWQPSIESMLNSQMHAFMDFINQEYQQQFENYEGLYQWSIAHPELFWPAIWRFCQVISSSLWQEVIINQEKMPGAQWFLGAQLNFAENLLRFRDDKIAVIFYNEQGTRRTLTYQQLYFEVAKLAISLRNAGVTVNDRIVGFMPNMPETLIALLATTSIGAIWSSCSPDFGYQAIRDRFTQIQPKILFTTDGYYYNGTTFNSLEKITELEKQLPCLQKIIVVPYIGSPDTISLTKKQILYTDFLSSDTSNFIFSQLPFDHPLYISYSSGTTGLPKCIVHGAGGVLLQHMKELMLHTNIQRHDVFFYYTSCGWMMWNWLVSGLLTGCTLVLYDGAAFYPKNALFNLIEKEHISIFGTSAKYLATAEKTKLVPIHSHNLSSLKTILSTGSPLLPLNYDYVYQKIKTDVHLASISGGTDIVSCFALGNPLLPVYRGELQCRGLGLKVEIYDELGNSVKNKPGELVCTAPFPVMPLYFWNDADGKKYHQAYFAKFPHVWTHGDYAEITPHHGLIIYGRSDAVLNPGGVRIGTAEIYRQVEKIPEVLESIVIGQNWHNDMRIILFVKLQPGQNLTEELQIKIKQQLRKNASPHHVPAKIIAVPDIPRTLSGKIMELAVSDVIHGRLVKNIDSIANPEALMYFKDLKDLR